MIATSAVWDGWPGLALLVIAGVLCYIGEKLSTIGSTLSEMNDSLGEIQSACEELAHNSGMSSEPDPYDS